jgi:two-component system, cell cycle response regulator CpdR
MASNVNGVHKHRFQQVAAAIKERIISGHYREGERLPSQHRMASEFNVAFNTFKAALDVLETEGYVARKVGNGTFAVKPNIRRPRALAVDDHDGVREYLERALERCGWDCTAVESGALALKEMECTTYDLLLTDLVMPAMTGAQLVGEVRKRNRDLQVIIITAYPETKLMAEAMGAGPFAVLRKPTRLQDLRQILGTAIGSGSPGAAMAKATNPVETGDDQA